MVGRTIGFLSSWGGRELRVRMLDIGCWMLEYEEGAPWLETIQQRKTDWESREAELQTMMAPGDKT